MQQIADWLSQLGMSEYADRFVDNRIDISVLPHLTDQDLKDIGIPLGHRRKILAAINLGAGSIQPIGEASRVAEAKTQDAPERRFVTVMFSDLVGSTALSARMDPEDLREVISAYQKCVAETVGRFGGFVAKYMGDGVLVYFGYPQAHEDDAERAVRAGLELVAAVGGLKTHVALQTRVGIATGLVVVGDLIGSGASQEQAIVGETPNLAARLQGVAEPNSVVIAESTRKLVGNLFELEVLGRTGPQGYRRAGASLGGAATGFRGKPLRGFSRERPDGTCRAGRRTRPTAPALVKGKDRRRSSSAALWRARDRQIAADGSAAGAPRDEPHTRLRYFCSPSTPIARFTRSSARWSEPPDLRTTTPRKQSSTSSTRSWRSALRLVRTWRSLPKCCHCRTMDVIPRSNWLRSSGDKGRWKPLLLKWRHCRDLIRC